MFAVSMFRLRLSFLVVAAAVALLGRATVVAGEFPLYAVTFSSPPHTVGMRPVTGQSTTPNDRVSEIVFGNPTVISAFSGLTDQPLELRGDGGSTAYSQVRFAFNPDDFLVFDADVCVRASSQSPAGGITILFDTPQVRSVTFSPTGEIRSFVPFAGSQSIGTFELGKLTHFRAEVDLVEGTWRLLVNGVVLEEGDFAANDIEAVRINHDYAETQESNAAIDNVFITSYGFQPSFIEEPKSQVVAQGDAVQFSAVSHGPELRYQWFFNGSPIEGATGRTLTIEHAVAADAGDYHVQATNVYGSNVSHAAKLTLDYAPALIQNISTRVRVQPGDNALIGGFILQGEESKKLIVRAIGPSLNVAGTPVDGRLLDPTLQLYNGAGNLIATNDDWRDVQEQEIEDSTIPPKDDRESAIVAVLAPGNYTAIVRGKGDTAGVGLVEIYDLDARPVSEAVNISTRGRLSSSDDAMIGGFILGGLNPAQILVRGIGPSLNFKGTPVPDRLTDPTLEVRGADGGLIASNDNWKETQQSAIEQTGAPPQDDREAAILASLAPGRYTVIMRDAGGQQGVGLFEAYNVTQ